MYSSTYNEFKIEIKVVHLRLEKPFYSFYKKYLFVYLLESFLHRRTLALLVEWANVMAASCTSKNRN